MKNQLEIQEMHANSGKFGKPVKSIIDYLVDEANEGGVESLQQYYQAASELERSGEAWFNLPRGK